MSRFSKIAVVAAAVLAFAHQGSAFSLLGPLNGTQAGGAGQQIGYNPYNTDIGGPKNYRDLYRWNGGVLTYSFSQQFLDYFGSPGTSAVMRAIAMITNANPVAQTDLSQFPTVASRLNFQASALGLVDLKSTTAGILLNVLGLASPERYTWTIDHQFIAATFTNYYVIRRNFDPVTGQYSSYVNDVLFTYSIQEVDPLGADFFEAVETPADTTAFPVSALASAVDLQYGQGILPPGQFFIGLTRDDAGGLRYIYGNQNTNREQLLAGTILTPTLVTNPPPAGSPVGTPPTIVTNPVANITNRIGQGLPTFVYLPLDTTSFPLTNVHDDVYINVTNGLAVTQKVRRVLTAPDIVFDADPTMVFNAGLVPRLYRVLPQPGSSAWVNTSGVGTRPGPGIVQPPAGGSFNIAFNNLGQIFFDFVDETGFFLSEPTAPLLLWGSFDGTTNDPVIFPLGVSLQELEQRILGPSGP